jgi:hypothetical protein
MIVATLLSLVLAQDGFDASARVLSTSLAAGSEARFVVEIESDRPVDASWSTTTDRAHAAGLRKPVLQLEVPASVELLDGYKTEEERKERRDWLDFYFDRPYGRLVDSNRVEIPFRLVKEPAPGDEIGINLVTYLEGEDPEGARLVRLRLQLPVAADAVARKVAPDRSTWGDEDRMHIGSRAQAFALPSGWGDELGLEDFLGTGKPLFVMAYRSDW